MLVLTTGMIVADILCADLPRFADEGEMFFVPSGIRFTIGGHPANVAIDLVNLGLKPKDVGVIAAVGKDIFGEFIKKFLQKYKLNTFLQEIKDTATSKNIILILKNEDRRFHLDAGANLKLSADYVKKILLKHKPRVLCIRPGYSGIDLKIPFILKDLKNTFVMLDICQPYKKKWSYILPALKYVSALHCNENEAMKVAGKKNINDAVRKLLNYGVKNIFITSGEKGAKLITAQKEIFQKSFKVKAVDPTGCGDAFCAAVVYKLIKWNNFNLENLSNEKLSELLSFAQKAGALTATEVGTTTALQKFKIKNYKFKIKEN